jgi:hypothetical protein
VGPETFVEGPPRGLNRRVEIGPSAVGYDRENIPGRRIPGLECPAGGALPKSTVDEMAL